jgi:arginine/lysine/ornithine decarboxylase
MTQAFDPTGISYLMPGQQPSQAQLRYMGMWAMIREQFTDKETGIPLDQYVVVTPASGPEAVKCLTPEHAAQMIYDKQARLATAEQVEKYKMENELAQKQIQKELDKRDLSKAVSRVLND